MRDVRERSGVDERRRVLHRLHQRRLDALVEDHGRGAGDLAVLRGDRLPVPPVAEPAPVEVAPVEPAAPVANGAGFTVFVRLTSGERLTVADCADIGEAKGYAKALTKQLGTIDPDDWPFVNGRFLKPDTILSVDVEQS